MGASCQYGQDCGDCGPRDMSPPPPPRPSPPSPPPPPPPPIRRMSRPRPYPLPPPTTLYPPPMPMALDDTHSSLMALRQPSSSTTSTRGPASFAEPSVRETAGTATGGGGESLTVSSSFSQSNSWAARDHVDLGLAPPPPPPEPPAGHSSEALRDSPVISGEAEGDSVLSPETRERVKVLVGHGTAAAETVVAHGAHLAAGSVELAREAARVVQSNTGLSAEQVQIIALGAGLVLSVCLLCCCRCICGLCSASATKHRDSSRSARAHRVLASMSSLGRRRSHRALSQVDTYADDMLDGLDSDEELFRSRYGY
jgi:hypothetical protein